MVSPRVACEDAVHVMLWLGAYTVQHSLLHSSDQEGSNAKLAQSCSFHYTRSDHPAFLAPFGPPLSILSHHGLQRMLASLSRLPQEASGAGWPRRHKRPGMRRQRF